MVPIAHAGMQRLKAKALACLTSQAAGLDTLSRI